jgi:uncharacterized DUF497 family protein
VVQRFGAYHLEQHDDKHSKEELREITLASHPFDRSIILQICWTDRSTKGRQVTRIISARGASRKERKIYETDISKKK